jgi:hypothetical protein
MSESEGCKGLLKKIEEPESAPRSFRQDRVLTPSSGKSDLAVAAQSVLKSPTPAMSSLSICCVCMAYASLIYHSSINL